MALDGGKSDWWHGYENDAIIFCAVCGFELWRHLSPSLGRSVGRGKPEKWRRKKMKNDKVLLEKLRFSLLAFTTHTTPQKWLDFPRDSFRAYHNIVIEIWCIAGSLCVVLQDYFGDNVIGISSNEGLNRFIRLLLKFDPATRAVELDGHNCWLERGVFKLFSAVWKLTIQRSFGSQIWLLPSCLQGVFCCQDE